MNLSPELRASMGSFIWRFPAIRCPARRIAANVDVIELNV
jgi:hypothetical protein